ncbi:uncharacterized protein LOC107829707 [Nicotiana tabacum]|uniref:Uncharacterized protein LOC107829707 n=1 Tax=Nicotiana tabacum TaxID=4097 RepID=A0AC58UR96_TOBAC
MKSELEHHEQADKMKTKNKRFLPIRKIGKPIPSLNEIRYSFIEQDTIYRISHIDFPSLNRIKFTESTYRSLRRRVFILSLNGITALLPWPESQNRRSPARLTESQVSGQFLPQITAILPQVSRSLQNSDNSLLVSISCVYWQNNLLTRSLMPTMAMYGVPQTSRIPSIAENTSLSQGHTV